jgi:YidC/Oxa1 family membrane protein insertase
MKTRDPNNIHPEDMRNMFLFFVAALLVYFLYNNMIVKPQQEALRKASISALQVKTDAVTGLIEQQQRPRAEVMKESPRIAIDNGVIYGSIALQGGRIDDISFHEYYEEMEKKKNVTLLSPKGSEFPRYIEYGWIPADKATLVPTGETLWRVRGNEKLTKENPVKLTWDNGQGLRFERVFSIDENYMITVRQTVLNDSGRQVTLFPYGLITQTGFPPFYQGVWISHEGPIGYIGEELMEVKYKTLWKEPEQTYEASRGWAGITDKYWLTALIPPQGENVKYRVNRTGDLPGKKQKGQPLPKDWGRYQVDYHGDGITIDPGKTGESESRLFAGAKKVLQLEQYEKQYNIPHFDLAVDFGWFWFMTKPFFYILHFFDSTIGNMGVAIILLTILIRGAVFPLTNVSYRSFAKMKKVSPMVLEMRKTHSGDKKKLQEELVKLYEREGVNPVAGCFPMLIQIPIFFSLYKTLFVTIDMRHAPFVGWIHDLSAADPTNIFNLFGLLSFSPPAFLHIGIWPLLMMTLMYMQQKLNPPPQDPLQRDMAMYMPLMMTYIMSKFAAGLVIYWTFSALIGLIQQMIIMRMMDVPIHFLGETREEKKLEEEIEKGPAVHPLMEMAEKELFGEESVVAAGDNGPTVTPPKPRRKKKK